MQRSGSAQDSRPGDAEARPGATEQAKAPGTGTYGPPPPPPASRLPACPSSSERWAGPGGRLGRYPNSVLLLQATVYIFGTPRGFLFWAVIILPVWSSHQGFTLSMCRARSDGVTGNLCVAGRLSMPRSGGMTDARPFSPSSHLNSMPSGRGPAPARRTSRTPSGREQQQGVRLQLYAVPRYLLGRVCCD